MPRRLLPWLFALTLLFGQATAFAHALSHLRVQDSALAAQIGVLYAALLALWVWRGERLGRLGFYLVFALAITVSVQLAGCTWCLPA